MKVSRDTIRHWEAQRQAARQARQNDPLNNAAQAQELRAWLMTHWIPAHNTPERLTDECLRIWLKQANDNGGIVYIGRIWSVTGLPQSFDTWAAP